MAVVVAHGTFTIPTNTNAIAPALTWSDAGSHTPQLVLLRCVNGAGGTGTGNTFVSQGMTDGTTQFTQCFASEDNVAASNSASYKNSTGVLSEIGVNATLTGLIGFTSFGTDVFTITPSDAFAQAAVGEYIAFAGFDNVAVQVTQNSTSTGAVAKTGIGFQGTLAFFMGGLGATLATATGGNFGFGWATGGVQAALGYRVDDGATTDYTWGMVNTASVMIRPASTATTPEDQTSFTSFDANGYTLNHDVSNGVAHYYAVAVCKGGTHLATTTTTQTGAGTFTKACAGLTPIAVLGFANYPATASETTNRESGNVAFGALTAATQFSLSVHAFNRETVGAGQTTEEHQRTSTAAFLEHYDRASTDSFTATGVITSSALADELVTLDQTDADTALCLVPLLIIGNAYAGSGFQSAWARNSNIILQ